MSRYECDVHPGVLLGSGVSCAACMAVHARENALAFNDALWSGHEIERHARRAHEALEARDRLLLQLAGLAKLLELLELLGPRCTWDVGDQPVCMNCGERPATKTIPRTHCWQCGGHESADERGLRIGISLLTGSR